jgi:hypothetical protein
MWTRKPDTSPANSRPATPIAGHIPQRFFHISQTELTSEREARFAGKPRRGNAYRGWRNEGNRQVPDMVMPDPGELAGDQWAAEHCPSDNR